ncbi:protease inhibitor I42 family protein [Methanococcoides orientis]|uniref:protease inhibitor I42 family protein n=1 Tax=Methanococcoides orientis TaxID=2822137 RepID=UPI001E2B79ED|nr:protease inhibitor I42 family protein [Methanococcoides orientis]UGV40122.1 protease inhibitor I42 family protein [Methanococcoides orientis]
MSKYTGMGILVLITIVAVTMAAFSMGCTENGTIDLTDDVEIVESGAVLTEDANASEVTMEQNDLIVLKLKENPTTGYSWEVTVPEGLTLVEDDFVIAQEDEDLVGAGGIHEWKFQAENEGTYEISAIYKRSWENTTGDEDTFGMTVTVLASGEHDGEDDADGDDMITDVDDTEYIIRDAMVDDIEIFMMESFPLQVSVSATGYLPDGCTVIDEENIEVTRDGNTFNVALKTKRPTDAMCTQALVPFEVNIPLEVYGLEAGVYTVDVNGVTDTFEFTMDNVME